MNTRIHFKRLRALGLALLAAACLMLISGEVQARPLAATITVDTFSDDLTDNGNCTLREAVIAANTNQAVDDCPAGGDNDTIQLAAGTYTLTLPGRDEDASATGDLDVTSSLKIVGAGIDQTIIQAAETAPDSGQTIDRIFDVQPESTLDLQSATVQHGTAEVNIDRHPGSCILNYGQLMLSEVRVTACITPQAYAFHGAIANYHDLSVADSIIDQNKIMDEDGGGIYNNSWMSIDHSNFSSNNGDLENDGTASVSHSDFSGDRGWNEGIDNNRLIGISDSRFQDSTGVYYLISNSESSDLFMSNVTFVGNESALHSFMLLEGRVLMENITLFDNKSGDHNMMEVFGELEIINSTISGNDIQNAVFGLSADNPGSLKLTNVTVFNNTARAILTMTGGQAQVVNSILAQTYYGIEVVVRKPDCVIEGGSFTSLGRNIVSVADGCGWMPASGDQLGSLANPLDPLLAPLADNGGDTLTHALQKGSPAIDKARNDLCPDVDQRGEPRPQDGDGNGLALCDIGAYERESGPLVTPTATQPPELTIHVNAFTDDLMDNGNCTLREAVQAANTNQPVDECPAGGEHDLIQLDAGTYLLSLAGRYDNENLIGDLDVTSHLTIIGAGQEQTIIDGDEIDRIFDLQPGSLFSIQQLTLTDGKTIPKRVGYGDGIIDDEGGCLFNQGVAVLSDVLFYSCKTMDCDFCRGVGAANYGRMLIQSCTFDFNTMDNSGDGGGVANMGTMKVYDSLFTKNPGSIVNADGGTIEVYRTRIINSNSYANTGVPLHNKMGTMLFIESSMEDSDTDFILMINNGDLTVRNSTFSNNSAEWGLFNLTRGTALIDSSTFVGNVDVIRIDAPVEIINSTFSGNSNGLFEVTENGLLKLTNVTINDNQSNKTALYLAGGQVEVVNTILSGTRNDNDQRTADCKVESGTLTSLGRNIVSIADGCGWVPANGDQLGSLADPIDPLLAPLADNGGDTLTHALQKGSPAIDKARNDLCPEVDQRGEPRPQDGNGDGNASCDVGAYEAPAVSGPTATFTRTPGKGDTITPTPSRTPTATRTPGKGDTITPSATNTQPPKVLNPVCYLPAVFK